MQQGRIEKKLRMKTMVLLAVLGFVLATGYALPLGEDYIESSYGETMDRESYALPHNKNFMELSLDNLKKMESDVAPGNWESEQEDEGPQPHYQAEDDEEGEEESGEEESGEEESGDDDDDDDELGYSMEQYGEVEDDSSDDSPRHLRQNRYRFLTRVSQTDTEKERVGVRNPKRRVGPQPHYQTEDEAEGEEEIGEEEDGDDHELRSVKKDYDEVEDGSSDDSPRHLRHNRYRFLSRVSQSELERKHVGLRNPKRGVVTLGRLYPRFRGIEVQADERMHGW